MRRQLVLTAVLAGLLLPGLLSFVQSVTAEPAREVPSDLPVQHSRGEARLPSRPPTARVFRRPAPARAEVVAVEAHAEPRPLSLETLPDEARTALVQVAHAQLEALAEACGPLAPEVALGAFMRLDQAGLSELALSPILQGPSGAPVQALDEPLSPEFERCVDDQLWDQDWSLATRGFPAEAVLDVALSTRPWGEEPPQ